MRSRGEKKGKMKMEDRKNKNYYIDAVGNLPEKLISINFFFVFFSFVFFLKQQQQQQQQKEKKFSLSFSLI